MMRKTALFSLILLTAASFGYSELFLKDLQLPDKEVLPFRSPTKRYLGVHPYTEVSGTLSMQGVQLTQKPLYDLVLLQEERGVMGYHAASQRFRVFQDIIRFTLEEVVGLEFRRDFYFFRLPGDPAINNHPDAADFLRQFPSVNDNLPAQRDQIISTNFTLYSNYYQKYECSVVFFEQAISYKPPIFEEKIGLLFDLLGIPKSHVAELFTIGKSVEQVSGGVLFQLFDLSHQSSYDRQGYEMVDRLTYAAKKKGVPLNNEVPFSELFLATQKSDFLEQYRLVVNHFETLNPYSSLWMRRYDLNTAATVEAYEKKLRAAIRKLPREAAKVASYKQLLEQLFFTGQ